MALTVIETLRHGKVVGVRPGVSVKRSAKKRLVTLGVSSAHVTGGQSTQVRITLNAVGKLLLKRFHTLRLTLLILQQSASGKTRVASTTLVFRKH
jgi:hypothetical protein